MKFTALHSFAHEIIFCNQTIHLLMYVPTYTNIARDESSLATTYIYRVVYVCVYALYTIVYDSS